MKKALTLAVVAALAVSTQAVTISWGSGGQINIVDEGVPTLMVSSSLAGTTAMGLFFLGNTGGSLLTVEDLTSADAIVTSSTVGGKSSNSSTFTTQEYLDLSIAAGDVVAGDVFAVFFIYDTGDVSGWYTDATLTTMFNSTYTFTGSETDSTTGIGTWGNAGGTGQVYVPVPEPATAALAIAGLAMLIRRRK